ncbi:MAG: flagellar basal body protein FliL [Thermocrispum sp.]
MTYPGQGDSGGQQWQPQQQPQQQWQQPQQQWQQQWQQPYQQWQQGPPTGGFPPVGYGQQPQKKSRRGLVIGLVVALVALVGGGATWLALSLSGSAGAASPGEAADTLMTAVQDGDVIGMMDSLAPAEASVLSDMVADYVAELKRIEVLDPSADPENLTGIDIEATEELVFDDGRAKKVNDHVTMAALTDGTLQLSGKFSEIPLAKSFKDALIPPRAQAQLDQRSPNETLDIGAMVAKTSQPIYIATVEVDGEWYPSLFHTIAHYALERSGEQWPATATPAVGASSPNEAVNALVEAIRTTDMQRAIELMPPDEMAALHDLGPLLIEKVNAQPESQQDLPFELVKLETDEEEVSGGTRLTLRSLEVRITGGSGPSTMSLAKTGDCYTMTTDGQSQQMCAADLAEQVRQEAGSHIPPQAVEPIIEIVQAFYTKSLGVVTTEVDGKHYVSPLRTYSDVGLTLLKSIEPEHIRALIQAMQGR